MQCPGRKVPTIFCFRKKPIGVNCRSLGRSTALGFLVMTKKELFELAVALVQRPALFLDAKERKSTMKQIYTSYDQLPLTLQADDVAAVLGISRGGAYTLMH